MQAQPQQELVRCRYTAVGPPGSLPPPKFCRSSPVLCCTLRIPAQRRSSGSLRSEHLPANLACRDLHHPASPVPYHFVGMLVALAAQNLDVFWFVVAGIAIQMMAMQALPPTTHLA